MRLTPVALKRSAFAADHGLTADYPAIPMQKIVLLNPKGGSGKTTLATNLASHFAVAGLCPTLLDLDAQGSSTRWLSKRTAAQPAIHGIAGFQRTPRVTRSFATRVPADCQRLIVDTPAALDPQYLPQLTRQATAVLVPVLPSDIDIHAAARCIADLLLIAKIRREDQRIAVIANRAKKHTLVYRSLLKFLATLQIPVITTLRDSQAYLRVAESGRGLFEQKPYTVREDLEQWLPLLGWLARRESVPMTSGEPLMMDVPPRAAIHIPASLIDNTPPDASTEEERDKQPGRDVARCPAPTQHSMTSPKSAPMLKPFMENGKRRPG